MFKTLKSKFVFLSSGIILLSVFIPVLIIINQVRQSFHDRTIVMVEAATELLMDGLNESMMIGDNKEIQKILERISDNSSVDHVRIFQETGEISYSNRIEEVGLHIEKIEKGHIDSNGNVIETEVYLDENSNFYRAVQPIYVAERCKSCHQEENVIAYIDIDTQLSDSEKKFYTASIHFYFFLILLIVLLVSSFYILFNKLINKPISDLKLALNSVSKGNLNIKLPDSGDDEISELNHDYNNMARELKESKQKIEELHLSQLQRADKMATLGELTATMAHDINNFAAIIMSRADYMLYEFKKNKDFNKWQEDLEVINNQISKISAITKNILKHSKKFETNFIKCDITKVISESIKLIQPLAVKKNIAINLTEKLTRKIVTVDPSQIEQLMLNLIGNSIDAIKENGTINVTLSNDGNNNILLEVADNGPGIETNLQDKIFSPFFTTKEGEKGTGLGLFIVQKICENHNATIECKSSVNMGTTFQILLKGENNV